MFRSERQPKIVVEAPQGYEGEGFPVRRAFAGIPKSMLDPFIHMDQMGEIDYGPYEPKGTSWHPHRGFETVTYMLQGEFQHQDSHGGGGLLKPGDTQWMTAGSGILHIETPPEHLVISGGVFHGVQLWVNLPSHKKWLPPAYQHISGEDVTSLDEGNDFTLKVIAGELADTHQEVTQHIKGPGSTHTPINFFHLLINPNCEVVIPWPKNFNAVAHVLSGEGSLPSSDLELTQGTTVLFENTGDFLRFRAKKFTNSEENNQLSLILLGGEPIGEPVVHYGPFVMNTKEEIRQTFEDYEKGLLGIIPQSGLQPYRKK